VALAREHERTLDLVPVDGGPVAGIVLADHRQQIAEQLTLEIGQIAGDRVDRSGRGRALFDPDPDPAGLVNGRGGCDAFGVGSSARQGSALRLCRYLRPS
jgi:hypothetical protein